MRFVTTVLLSAFLASGVSSAHAKCSNFEESSMRHGDGPTAEWRTDYPTFLSRVPDRDIPAVYPWTQVNFETHPRDYMDAVLSKVAPHFSIKDDRLAGTGTEEWWISHWMDYGDFGRERRMGLTKERGPDTGDLAPGSSDDFQVWAVGFYNKPGAFTFGEVFSDPCNPFLPVRVRFPRYTVSIKFLFTDANPEEVTYLKGAPEFKAFIDPTPSRGRPENRVETTVRLIQLDIAVKDARASQTGWVFGTFGWVGPAKGDALFDNLEHVSLQWGDDAGVYDSEINESWINERLRGTMFGWDERPTLGFNGRANGPADNIRSSCISCHSAARVPRATHGILGNRFHMERDINSENRVRDHVDRWFTNRNGSEVFAPEQPAAAVLDYSLQLDAAIFRMCDACSDGVLQGETPHICRASGFYNRAMCTVRTPETTAELAIPKSAATFEALGAPPRQ